MRTPSPRSVAACVLVCCRFAKAGFSVVLPFSLRSRHALEQPASRTEQSKAKGPGQRARLRDTSAHPLMYFCVPLQRPEGVIAVVSHSGFLRCTSRQFAHDAAPIVKDELHRWCDPSGPAFSLAADHTV